MNGFRFHYVEDHTPSMTNGYVVMSLVSQTNEAVTLSEVVQHTTIWLYSSVSWRLKP